MDTPRTRWLLNTSAPWEYHPHSILRESVAEQTSNTTEEIHNYVQILFMFKLLFKLFLRWSEMFRQSLKEWTPKLESDWTKLTVPNSKQQNKYIQTKIVRSLGQTAHATQTICSKYHYQHNTDHNRTWIIITRVLYFATATATANSK